MNKFFVQLRSELQKSDHLYIRVKVRAKAPKTEIVDQLEGGTYKVRVGAQPVKGASNAELLRYLKKELDLADAQIVSGGRDSVKLIRLSKF